MQASVVCRLVLRLDQCLNVRCAHPILFCWIWFVRTLSKSICRYRRYVWGSDIHHLTCVNMIGGSKCNTYHNQFHVLKWNLTYFKDCQDLWLNFSSLLPLSINFQYRCRNGSNVQLSVFYYKIQLQHLTSTGLQRFTRLGSHNSTLNNGQHSDCSEWGNCLEPRINLFFVQFSFGLGPILSQKW